MTNAEIDRRHKNAIRRLSYQRVRDRQRAAGLSSRGTPYLYTMHPDLSHLSGRALKTARQRKYYQALQSQGLTTRGSIRRLRRYPQFAHLHGPARHKALVQLYTVERRAAGFTARGTPRLKFSGPRTASPAYTLNELSYRRLRDSLGDCRAPDFLSQLERHAA